ncbi:MAG: lactonase family protein [Bacteroidales bacterium]|jgi:6-phosphogluconolactonase|nr:lactonase family protein [Bacteroidales bacterium]MDX9812310.1 lactonase family protein [Bacteroidales bacterium]HNX84424.1 lactonase family protein [Bacteroidales bacterium]HOC48065.1 lactonase family protein [Bacteroidales bacterium]HPS98564.1 lactonase family protein [Bacteroidales bacterium]
MKITILLLMMMLTTLMSSCNMGENMFIASGYSRDGAADVLLCRLNGNGSIDKISEIIVGDNPSYFTLGRGGLIYLVNEVDTFNTKAGGGITTLRYNKKSKSLEKVSSMNQGGGGPCHIEVSVDGKFLITSNYGSGSVSVLRLNGEGIPEKVTDVIFYGEKSHPHMTIHNPRLHTYYVSDLGLDRVHQLKLDTTLGLLMNADIAYFNGEPGSGPRHMAIDKSSANLYVINELNSTATVYNILSDTVTAKQTVSALPEEFTEKSYCADIHLSRNGKKIYGSNRGHNSIVTFRVGVDGKLSEPSHRDCGGNWPRNFAVSPSGKFFLVANQRSDEISVVREGAHSDEAVSSLTLNAPSCVRFLK